MNKSIIAINITDNGQVLNDGLVPILLYTENVNESIENIFNLNLDIGHNFYNYIYKQFIRQDGKVDFKRYLNIQINCIFFDPNKKTHVNVHRSLQEIHPINPETDQEIMSAIIEHLNGMRETMKDFNEYLDSIGLTKDNKETVINEQSKKKV